MPTLIIETEINAPPEVCFDLVRDISLYVQNIKNNGDKAIFREAHGEIKPGETVTFEGKHFGLPQRFTVKVIEVRKPFYFMDRMIEGNFKSFEHKHEFIKKEGGTLMRDTVCWVSPLGLLGRFFDWLLIKEHLRQLVLRRNAELKRFAEK